ncbi:MAG: aspartyl protease family protein [Alphaproteobacteria bacterium]|nr:retroviral-like aspartic protease family protein [Alphaproteobacteria bacterium]MDE2111573.1 aspartyl protease family protein [Alphaproteobacteria bacterium]MDE2494620.1 aspartyl protease family protein [Alphaproteobacteria bacterium]
MRRFLAAFAVMFAAAGAYAHAEEDCRLQLAASLPMTMDRTGRMSIPAAVGGHPLQLMIDTRTPGSVLTRSAADALGLRPHLVTAPGIGFRMYGGERLVRFVRVKDFALGEMKDSKAQFLVMTNPLPPGIDGLIGWDFLSQFDVDFDFANAKLNFFMPHRCEGRAVYWTQNESAIAKIPFELNEQENPHIVIPVEIDGHGVKAIVDTSASRSALDLGIALDTFGLDTASAGMRRIGNPSDPAPSYRYPFRTLTFEGVTVSNPDIVLVPVEKSHFDSRRLLLGIGILRQLHFYIAYQERNIYVTAAGAH